MTFRLIFITFFFFSIQAQRKNLIKYFTDYFPDGHLKQSGILINDIKTGVWCEYEITGKLKSYFTFKEGKLNGWFAEFDVYGNITKEGTIENEHYSGITYEYEGGKLLKKTKWLMPYAVNRQYDTLKKINQEVVYDLTSGLKRSEGFWIDNQKDSLWLHYDERQVLKAVERYRQGKRHGTQEKYYPDGKLAERASFKFGQMEGVRLLLTESGDTTEFGNYVGSKRNGFFILKEPLRIKDLSNDEKPYRVEGHYEASKPFGSFVLKYPNGKTAAEEYYLESKLNGKRVLYRENGRVAYVGQYEKGIKNGAEKLFYASGAVQSESEFINGKLNGNQIYYYENGTISELFKFSKGELKSLNRFFPNGKLKEKVIYENGKLKYRELYNDSGQRIKQ